MGLQLQVLDKKGVCMSRANGENSALLVHKNRYHRGDTVMFICDVPGFYEVMLEDTMPPTLVYVEKQAKFVIPFGTMPRVGYSPRAFKSVQHLLTARRANPAMITARRNLALNPYDQHGETGMFPHASANVETRNEALFAARNAIDGMFANHAHYPYPFQSWGINKDPHAELTVQFGVPVSIDTVVLTLRADYPHDSYWTQATLEFSDGSDITISLEKSDAPQAFSCVKQAITWVKLKNLMKHEDESPFPALTQIEVWGTVTEETNHG